MTTFAVLHTPTVEPPRALHRNFQDTSSTSFLASSQEGMLTQGRTSGLSLNRQPEPTAVPLESLQAVGEASTYWTCYGLTLQYVEVINGTPTVKYSENLSSNDVCAVTARRYNDIGMTPSQLQGESLTGEEYASMLNQPTIPIGLTVNYLLAQTRDNGPTEFFDRNGNPIIQGNTDATTPEPAPSNIRSREGTIQGNETYTFDGNPNIRVTDTNQGSFVNDGNRTQPAYPANPSDSGPYFE